MALEPMNDVRFAPAMKRGGCIKRRCSCFL